MGQIRERPRVVQDLRPIARSFAAPEVLSGREVQALLEHTSSLRDKAIFMLMYGSGLRISETVALLDLRKRLRGARFEPVSGANGAFAESY